ncbi:exonuclease SbcCD subunit D [Advenella sp. WQ 585]|uniref:Nuclease SbcCD subunit D n=1 Tax=Advenella mandrilli TaxID=2800330 RepID=A0ABS1EFJ4_9BURK|nr:exonuclease SbcCD subunit D [Advenella mandrilli]MBK1781470.1 exonuclease SbcCD subunit D [Advenella mandrilli]
MKFIHTSDWHLGRQFASRLLIEDQEYVLDQMIAYLEQYQVQALLVSGDVYDRSVPPVSAVALLDKTLNRIAQLNIPVIMIPGNHDSARRLGFAAQQLSASGVHIIADFEQMLKPVIINANDEQIAFYGMPFNDPELVRNYFQEPVNSYEAAHCLLAEKIKQVMNPESVNVLLAHCFLEGAVNSESERPLSIGGSDVVPHTVFDGFDYVALGHLHAPQYKGAEHIRYSGSILKYSFSEQFHNKGVTLVGLDANGQANIQNLPLKPLHDVRTLEGTLADIVEMGRQDPHAHDYVLVKLADTHAVLDPVGKIREVYPNVLQLEKPGLYRAEGEVQAPGQALKRDEYDLFCDFFEQVAGQALSEPQKQAVKAVILDVRKEEQA